MPAKLGKDNTIVSECPSCRFTCIHELYKIAYNKYNEKIAWQYVCSMCGEFKSNLEHKRSTTNIVGVRKLSPQTVKVLNKRQNHILEEMKRKSNIRDIVEYSVW